MPCAPLTLLVGPNGSGKSNVLDALRFLQGLAFDYPLGDVLRGRWEGQRELWAPIRGGLAEAGHAGSTRFGFESEWSFDGAALLHHVFAILDGDARIEMETLSKGTLDRYLFSTHAPALKGATGAAAGGAISVALRAKGKGNSVTATYSSMRSLLGQIEAKDRVLPEVLERISQLRQALRDATFLDIRPALMRDYRPLNGGHLGTAGENISPVLFGLDPSKLADVVDWMSELCAPEIEGIEFDETKLREVMMLIVERQGRTLSARSASDGTLRFLGELVALLTADAGSLLILEEPDVGLHPSRIRLLAELLETVSKRGVQVIATTHSPTLLAHLSESSLGSVLAFGRDPESGDTICSRVGNLPHFEELVRSRDVEHLVSTGWLERAL